MSIEQDFLEYSREMGILFGESIIADDTLHRSYIEDHKPGTKNGAYAVFTKIPAGWGMDYKTGDSFKWNPRRRSGKLTKADMDEIAADKLNRQKQQEEARHQAALKAQRLWARAIYADARNGYCTRKKILPHGAKTASFGSLKGVLILPLYNAKGELVNLQFIQPDGTKRFLSGGEKKNCFWSMGELTGTILVAEGYATGCSLFEQLGLHTVIAFDAGNLSNVAQIIRSQNTDAVIIICVDNDESGVGQTKAREAALAIGGKMLIPPTVGHDWNDAINAGHTIQGSRK